MKQLVDLDPKAEKERKRVFKKQRKATKRIRREPQSNEAIYLRELIEELDEQIRRFS